MKKLVFSIVAFSALAHASLFAETWFDAGVADYESWPANGAERQVDGAGVWRGTAFAELVGAVGSAGLAVSTPKAGGLAFDLAEPKAAGAMNETVTTTLTLAVADVEEPLPEPKSLCALAPAWVSETEAAFFGLVLDAEGSTNAWRRLTGATPREGAEVTLGFSLKPGDGVKLVRYSVNDQALTLDGEAWLPIKTGREDDATRVASVNYAGTGKVTALGATTGEEPVDPVVPEPTLDVSAPAVGRPLEVVMTSLDGVTVKWLRSEGPRAASWLEHAEGAVYTPTAADYGHWLKCMVTDGDGRVAFERAFYFSKLPVFHLTTDDGLTPTAEKEEHDGHVYVQGNAEWTSPYDGAMTIKVRGNSTKQYDKKPWKIKLDAKTKMFGMPKSKHWVLLANALDNSQLRNKLAYDFANEIGSQGMRSTWAECFLNGEYCGLYQFCEHIRVDKDRVDVFDWEGAGEDAADAIAETNGFAKSDKKALEALMASNLTWVTSGTVTYTNVVFDVPEDFKNLDVDGGCLVEMSTEYDEVTKFRISSGRLNGMPVMVNSPEFLGTNAEMLEKCVARVQDFFNACTAADGYNAKGRHWSELADADSMVAYFLVVEMFGNDDAAEKSRYLHWDAGEAIVFGPVWDFDWGVGNTMLAYAPEGWKVQKPVSAFYCEWADDPSFCTRLVNRYWATAREPFAHILAEDGELDRYEAYLSEAAAANSTIYNADFCSAVQRLRNYLTARLAWLDQQFKDVPTLMASLKNSGSTNPYAAETAKLPIEFANAPTGVVGRGEALLTSVAVGLPTAVKVGFYANGLKVGESVEIANGSAQCTIPAAALDAMIGELNCVEAIGFDADGKTLARNYALVTTSESVPATEIIVVGPDGVTNTEDFVSVEDAVTNRPYGSLVEIPVVIEGPLAVTLEPGVKVVFAEGQLFGESALTFKTPGEWYDVRNMGVEAWVALNALAKPEFATEGEVPGEEPIEVGAGDDGEVILRVANVKPNLIYGVKAAAALPALGAAKPANWTQADGEGHLPNGALTVEKPSPTAGFFIVTVTDDPQVL